MARSCVEKFANTLHREKLQACPKIQNGEVDMDVLCSELQQKAKCSGDGPFIDEHDFTEVMRNVVKKEPRTA